MSFLGQAVLFLGLSVSVVPLFHKLGLGAVVGYILSGLLVGPSVLGLIPDAAQVIHFSELGVVFLLFIIGLELNPTRLWTLRRSIFGLGAVQVLVCALLAYFVAKLAGFSHAAAIVIGLCMTMSSTAIALTLIRDRGWSESPGGEASFSVLLFQDLAVIPILALVPYLSESPGNLSSEDGGYGFLKLPAACLGIILAGRYAMRPMLRWVATTGQREVLTAAGLLLVVGISLLMQVLGLSPALGAFLGGVVLANSEYRHELEADIEPFKGLLLGLFFMSVGMGIELSGVGSLWRTLAWMVPAMLLSKIVGLFAVARLFRIESQDSRMFAFALSQGGEFAFVLLGVATQASILDSSNASLISVVIAVSMFATSPLLALHSYLLERRLGCERQKNSAKFLLPGIQDNSTGDLMTGDAPAAPTSIGPVIIVGFGRFGQPIARFLHSLKVDLTLIDRDPSQIEFVRSMGWKAFYGDAARTDLLEAAGAKRARALVFAIDDMDVIEPAVTAARKQFPHLKIYVRASTRPDAYPFVRMGIPVFREMLGSSLELSESLIRDLGYSAYEAKKLILHFKSYDAAALAKAAHHVATEEETAIHLAAFQREELVRLMNSDAVRLERPSPHGWG